MAAGLVESDVGSLRDSLRKKIYDLLQAMDRSKATVADTKIVDPELNGLLASADRKSIQQQLTQLSTSISTLTHAPLLRSLLALLDALTPWITNPLLEEEQKAASALLLDTTELVTSFSSPEKFINVYGVYPRTYRSPVNASRFSCLRCFSICCATDPSRTEIDAILVAAQGQYNAFQKGGVSPGSTL